MGMSNCPRCGKVFSDSFGVICNECRKEEDEIYSEVREYVKENKNATLANVVANTRATPKKIMKYIRDGRLEVSAGLNSDIDLRCEKCRKPIASGKYCDSCVIKINQDVKEMFTVDNTKKAKMHVRGSARK